MKLLHGVVLHLAHGELYIFSFFSIHGSEITSTFALLSE
jgi:hypothetical protein